MTGRLILTIAAIGCGLAAAVLAFVFRGPWGVGAHAPATAPAPATQAEVKRAPQSPPPAAADATLQVFAGKVVPLTTLGGKAGDGGAALVTDEGTVYPLAEDAARTFLSCGQLRDRPVRLSGQRTPGTNTLRVESIQTVTGGKVYDVDFWCEVCQISLPYPGVCVCCGDPTVLRERPVR
jgi:hypothetical protein